MSDMLRPVFKSEVPEGVELETCNYNVVGSLPQILVRKGDSGEPFYMDKKAFYEAINSKGMK